VKWKNKIDRSDFNLLELEGAVGRIELQGGKGFIFLWSSNFFLLLEL